MTAEGALVAITVDVNFDFWNMTIFQPRDAKLSRNVISISPDTRASVAGTVYPETWERGKKHHSRHLKNGI